MKSRMNAVIKKLFDKLSSSEFKRKVRTKQEDDEMEVEKTCDSIIVVGKESLWKQISVYSIKTI